MFVQSRLRLAPPFLARIPPSPPSNTVENRSEVKPDHPYQSTLYSFFFSLLSSIFFVFDRQLNPSIDSCIKETDSIDLFHRSNENAENFWNFSPNSLSLKNKMFTFAIVRLKMAEIGVQDRWSDWSRLLDVETRRSMHGAICCVKEHNVCDACWKLRVTHVVNHRHCHKIVILYSRELRSKNNVCSCAHDVCSIEYRAYLRLVVRSSLTSLSRERFHPTVPLFLSDIFYISYLIYLRVRDPIPKMFVSPRKNQRIYSFT